MYVMNELETSILNNIKSLIGMISRPWGYMSESEFALHKQIKVSEYKLITHMSYRICGNDIKKRLNYLKSEETKIGSDVGSFKNISAPYDEVNRIELVYRYIALRLAISVCETYIKDTEECHQKSHNILKCIKKFIKNLLKES